MRLEGMATISVYIPAFALEFSRNIFISSFVTSPIIKFYKMEKKKPTNFWKGRRKNRNK